MSIAEADLGKNGNATSGGNGNGGKADGEGDRAEAKQDTNASTAQASAGSDQSATAEDCLAQAQVKMPWLDFNARLQLKGSRKKDLQQSKEAAGFRLPGFSIRKKQKTESDAKQNGKTSGTSAEEWCGEDLSVPKKKRLWSGWDGLTVSLVGIALPALILFLSLISIPKRLTLVLLNHPLETIVELVLMIGVPLINFLVWSAICKNKYRFSLIRGLAMGSAIGTSFIVAAVCITALFAGQPLQTELGTEFAIGFVWIAFFSLLTGVASIYIANRTRLSHDFEKSRLRILTVTITGAMMSLAAFAAAEARPWYIRIAEEKALSNVASEREAGWNLLRTLNPEREILMECSDSRAAGLCGLFLPIKSSTQHQLYFALTGKPYSFKDIANTDLSSMPDDYLSRHVVGDKVPGLSMTRSSMTGLLHANTLSSTLDWTFVFKNQGQAPQEARAELGLPPGAVITGLTLWNKGEPQEAAFAAAGKAEKLVSANITAGHESPAIITDLGHGRSLLHCFPVKDAEELKVRVTMVMPLKPDGSRGSTLALPRLIAENFELSDEHQIRLRASQPLSSSAKTLIKGTNPDGTQAIYGSLSKDQVESANVVIAVARDEFAKPVAVLDKLAIEFQKIEDRRLAELKQRIHHHPARLDTEVLSVSIDGSRSIQKQFEELTQALEKRSEAANHRGKKKPQIKAVTPKYVVETVSKIAAPAPKNLMIVVDGSATLKEFRPELLNALGKIPENVPTRVLIASDEDKAPAAMSLKEGLQKLSKEEFLGGHDNLKSVVKAAELAGETERGAVLWIHGPQPVLNQEIYIMAPYLAAPAFYELPLGAGDTDTYDFFKNHSEIGPFSQIPRTSRSVSQDLLDFFSKWRANQNGYEVSLAQKSEKPDQFASASPEAERELLTLHANQQVKELILARHIRKAARVAVAYGMVTPVSCALVTQNSTRDTDIDDLAQANRSENDGTTGASPVLFANALVGGVPSASSNAEQGSISSNLQGATNGTLGPQGADATYVTGVNTGGTVRVNNLANLEALLVIIANLSEIGLFLGGVIIVVHSFASKKMIVEILGQEIELGQSERILIGIGLIAFGLCFPGIINWFVASARDANLFS